MLGPIFSTSASIFLANEVPFFASLWNLYDATTSSAVRSRPSWNLTPSRIVTSQTFWSSLADSQLVAISGTGSRFSSTQVSVL